MLDIIIDPSLRIVCVGVCGVGCGVGVGGGIHSDSPPMTMYTVAAVSHSHSVPLQHPRYS